MLKKYLKSNGIKSIAELARISGVAEATLRFWWKERPVALRFMVDGIKANKFKHRGVVASVDRERILTLLKYTERTTLMLATELRINEFDIRAELNRMEAAGLITYEEVMTVGRHKDNSWKWFLSKCSTWE